MLNRLLHRSFLQRLQVVISNETSSYIYKIQNKSTNLLNYVHFHTSIPNKVIVASYENTYAYNVLTRIKRNAVEKFQINGEVKSLEDFNIVLDQDWRHYTASEIVNAFQNVKTFCIDQNINISDERFDKLVDGLMDQCEHLTVNEISDLLSCLAEMPNTEAVDSHNFHDVWSCLDDICCWKMVDWDVDTSLEIAKLWYKLNLGRLCDFIYVLVDRLVRKAGRLNKNQLVNVLFCFNVCRLRPVDFEYEYALENAVHLMDADELAIVAMGYFKTKTKIKIVAIMQAMVNSVIHNSKTIHEISLSAILKILRNSNPSKIFPDIQKMLDVVSYEIPRLSHACCLHIALLGTGKLQYCHPETLKKVSQKFVEAISDPHKIRLKDIERILLATTMFDFDPLTEPDLFKACLEEIQKDSRITEEVKYARALVCALYFLSVKNLYSYELMDRVLNKDYIELNYGKVAKLLPRELLSLDCSIDIECPDYTGTRLSPDMRYRGAKWLTEYLPTKNYKISQADQFFLDVLETVKGIVDEKHILVQHVLPQFVKSDIILCQDKNTKKFIEPPGFQRYILGDVMFPLKDDNLKWFILVAITWTQIVRNSSQPIGQMLFKKRQLEKMGYKPIFVIWNEFMELSPEAKRLYILEKIKK